MHLLAGLCLDVFKWLVHELLTFVTLGKQCGSFLASLHPFVKVGLDDALGLILVFLCLLVARELQVLVDGLFEVPLLGSVLLDDLAGLLNRVECLVVDLIGSLQSLAHFDIYFVIVGK